MKEASMKAMRNKIQLVLLMALVPEFSYACGRINHAEPSHLKESSKPTITFNLQEKIRNLVAYPAVRAELNPLEKRNSYLQGLEELINNPSDFNATMLLDGIIKGLPLNTDIYHLIEQNVEWTFTRKFNLEKQYSEVYLQQSKQPLYGEKLLTKEVGYFKLFAQKLDALSAEQRESIRDIAVITACKELHQSLTSYLKPQTITQNPYATTIKAKL
jgi:hypothetical protein